MKYVRFFRVTAPSPARKPTTTLISWVKVLCEICRYLHLRNLASKV
jgi:hypothetical protein